MALYPCQILASLDISPQKVQEDGMICWQLFGCSIWACRVRSSVNQVNSRTPNWDEQLEYSFKSFKSPNLDCLIIDCYFWWNLPDRYVRNFYKLGHNYVNQFQNKCPSHTKGDQENAVPSKNYEVSENLRRRGGDGISDSNNSVGDFLYHKKNLGHEFLRKNHNIFSRNKRGGSQRPFRESLEIHSVWREQVSLSISSYPNPNI